MSEQPGTDLVQTTPAALGIPVAQFEGEYIRHMVGKLPSITIEMPVGYKKGTHLRLEVEVRVKDVGFPDLKVGRETVTARVHSLVYEDVKLVGAYTHEEDEKTRPGVSGDVDE